MTTIDLIRVLQKPENDGKEIKIVDIRAKDEFDLEYVSDVSSVLELIVDLGEDPEGCPCNCEPCQDCEYA